jgi:hypothetical protein
MCYKAAYMYLLGITERMSWENQKIFLAAFAQEGKDGRGAQTLTFRRIYIAFSADAMIYETASYPGPY